ncbi:Hypothetical predicted protein, partial [Mytilus galloprovincialis]
KTIHYLALVCIVHTCLVHTRGTGGRDPREEESKTTAADGSATSASSTTIEQSTTLTTFTAGNLDVTKPPTLSSSLNVAKQSTSGASEYVEKSATPGLETGPNSKAQLSLTTVGSGAETGPKIQSVKYYLGIVICILVCKNKTTITMKIRRCCMIYKEMTFPKNTHRVLGIRVSQSLPRPEIVSGGSYVTGAFNEFID